MTSHTQNLLEKTWTTLSRRIFCRSRPTVHVPSLDKSLYASTTEVQQAEQTIALILQIHERLENIRAEEGLSPGAEVNKLFGKLVGICTDSCGRDFIELVVSDDRIKGILSNLRQLCAEGESLLEAHSVRVIIGSDFDALDQESVFQRLQAFPYYQNYIELARLELAALYAASTPLSRPIRKMAFIGSGPLPLSSLCLRDTLASEASPFRFSPKAASALLALDPVALATAKEETGDQVTIMNIDRDGSAIDQSRTLCQALGERGRGMEFLCADIGAVGTGVGDLNGGEADKENLGKDENWLQEYDAVFLAALVGANQEEKEEVLQQVAGNMRVGALLVVRSADGMRKVLYPEFDHTSEKVRAVLDVDVVLHPQNQVVNSVIVGKVKKRPCLSS